MLLGDLSSPIQSRDAFPVVIVPMTGRRLGSITHIYVL